MKPPDISSLRNTTDTTGSVDKTRIGECVSCDVYVQTTMEIKPRPGKSIVHAVTNAVEFVQVL